MRVIEPLNLRLILSKYISGLDKEHWAILEVRRLITFIFGRLCCIFWRLCCCLSRFDFKPPVLFANISLPSRRGARVALMFAPPPLFLFLPSSRKFFRQARGGQLNVRLCAHTSEHRVAKPVCSDSDSATLRNNGRGWRSSSSSRRHSSAIILVHGT